MVATAKEREAFLEAKGRIDEDAKTRAQQKEIEKPIWKPNRFVSGSLRSLVVREVHRGIINCFRFGFRNVYDFQLRLHIIL